MTATASPTTNLVDGTAVEVTISGLDQDDFVQVGQCRAGADPDLFSGGCDSDAAYGYADQPGEITVPLRVDALITVYDPEAEDATEVDCRTADACVIGWSAGDGEASGTIPLHFTPGGALAPPPTATVAPTDDLTDQQSVTVDAAGLVWSTRALIFQCATDPADLGDCTYDNADFIELAPTATTYAGQFTAYAVIDTINGETVDCREPDACVLAVSQNDLRSHARTATVPLAFDPDTEIVPPTLTVAPDEDLVDGQSVRLTGGGYHFNGNGTGVRICTGGDLENAACEWFGSVWIDEEGALDETVRVYAVLQLDDEEHDCRTAEEPCQLVVGNGSPSSPRSSHAPLHFDPDGELLPTPSIEVEPATDLAEDATVTVTGTGFMPNSFVSVNQCRTGTSGNFEGCDQDGGAYVDANADGELTVELPLVVSFRTWFWNGEDDSELQLVDCRTAPGCQIVAQGYEGRSQSATAPITFAPEPPGGGQRYLDRVFDDVAITRDVVYHDTHNDQGQPVQLGMDIYEPEGDTVSQRPAVVLMHGGWFDQGGKADMASYASDFARRGYVAVTIDYRTTRNLDTSSPQAIKAAMLAGYDNAAAALAFLDEHAGHYRIDPAAITAAGAGAGATNAFDLAYLPGEHGRTGDTGIAAALAIGGVSLGSPDPGDVPVLAFNGSDSTLAPLHMAQWTCEDAAAVAATCEAVVYEGSFYDLEYARQRDITRRSLAFLADEVLKPLGYIEDDHDPSSTTSTTEHQHPTTSGSGGSGNPTTTSGSGPGSGHLPNTGSNTTMPLVLVGLALSLGGGGLVFLARRRRLRGAGAVAAVLLVALAVPVLSRDASSAQEPPHEHPTTTSAPTTSTTEHQHPTTTVAPTTSTTTGSTTSTTHHGGGGHEFPPDWDDEQVAYANQLIADTEESLARFDTQAVLPLMGYVWILDGAEVGTFQHWISISRIGFSGSTIEPDEPESFVYRQTEDGPVLEAAMYILGANHVGLGSVPEPIRWLPGWHIHENLCFDDQFRIVGVTDENGQCARGTNLPTPPMVHVWIVDTECGRFAGVDENGLMCDPEHPHD